MTESPGLPAAASNPTSSRIRLLASQLMHSALDLVFPPRCIECRRAGSLFCASCQAKYPPVAPIRNTSSAIDEQRSTAEFGGSIQKAIHALKYDNRTAFAGLLGQ